MLWVYHIWLLLCWGMFLLCLLSEEFYHKWVLNFVKRFFCLYWDDHMVLIFQFVNMMYQTDWFMYIEEILHSWDTPDLIMVYDLFNVLLKSICWNFFEDFTSMFISYIDLKFSFFCVAFVWFSCQGGDGSLEWVWKCSFLCHLFW